MTADSAVPLRWIQFDGKIHLITNDRDFLLIADQLMNAKALGFDTETRPSFKKGEVYPVSLLQLATDGDAYLIRLRGLSHFKSLIDLFENPQVLKVGLALRDDLKLLQKRFEFKPKNFIELQDVAKTKGLKNFGLKGMTEEVLHARLSKKAKITNWDAPVLTAPQILYAATDAWISLKLYTALHPSRET